MSEVDRFSAEFTRVIKEAATSRDQRHDASRSKLRTTIDPTLLVLKAADAILRENSITPNDGVDIGEIVVREDGTASQENSIRIGGAYAELLKFTYTEASDSVEISGLDKLGSETLTMDFNPIQSTSSRVRLTNVTGVRPVMVPLRNGAGPLRDAVAGMLIRLANI